MSSLIGSLFSGATGESADKLIAYNASAGAATAAQAYFSAALAATTPELRAFLSGYCNQSLTGQEAVMNYMIQKNGSILMIIRKVNFHVWYKSLHSTISFNKLLPLENPVAFLL